MSAKTRWNADVILIVSDVDETIADVYMDAKPEIISELVDILEEGKALFLISGQGIKNIIKRVVRHIRKELRQRILVGHCSGAEVFGFDSRGSILKRPFYSVYEERMSKTQKRKFREIVKQLTREFGLKTYPTMPVAEFVKRSGKEPLSIMLDDRGPQITFEVVNGYNLPKRGLSYLRFKLPMTHSHYDLRIPIFKRAEQLFSRDNLPVTPRLGGMFALDFAVEGVSKTTAVRYVLNNEKLLGKLGLSKSELSNPRHIEVWGDKFSIIRGGTDRHMSEALPKKVRSISFRKEEPSEFPKGYNIVVWDGKEHLQEGLLEYLRSRKR